jgi:isocitrate/isopropylmalate dehydrogenase
MSTNVPITVAHGDGIGPEIMEAKDGEATSRTTVALVGRVLEQGIEIVKTETMRSYDGAAGYTLSQGQ